MEANGTEFKWYHKITAGGLAGLVAQTATYPLDVVRRRMQTERFLLDVQTNAKPINRVGGKTNISTPPILSMQLGARRTWRGGGAEFNTPEIRYTSIVQTLKTITYLSPGLEGRHPDDVKGIEGTQRYFAASVHTSALSLGSPLVVVIEKNQVNNNGWYSSLISSKRLAGRTCHPVASIAEPSIDKCLSPKTSRSK